MRSAEAYWGAPVLRKLFGYGMNQFPVFIEAYGQEMAERYQAVFIDAHNEFLQMLASFFAQGITNSQQVFTTPLYFVFLGM